MKNGAGSGACPNEPIATDQVGLKPSLDPISAGAKVSVKGKLSKPSSGNIQICVNGQPAGKLAPVTADGTFNTDVGTVTDGETIMAQFVGDDGTLGPYRSVKVGAKDTCPGLPQDNSEGPSLNPVDAPANAGDPVSISGSFKSRKSVKALSLEFCIDGTPQTVTVDVDDNGNFPASNVTVKKKTAAQAGTDDGLPKIVAQAVTGGPTQAFSPVSKAIVVGSCSQLAGGNSNKADKPSLKTTTTNGQTTYLGTFDQQPSSTTVRICINDAPTTPTFTAAKDTSGSGYNFKVTSLKVNPGDVVQAQIVTTDATTKKNTYGPLSDESPVGPCTATKGVPVGNVPTIAAPENRSTFASVGVRDKNQVRICVNGQPITPPLDASGGAVQLPAGEYFVAGQKVTAQEIVSAPGDFPRKYGELSSEQKVLGYNYTGLTSSFIGGVEESAFSSQNSNTNAFLSAYFRSPYYPWPSRLHGTAVWTRIRLLGAPSLSTTSNNFNIVAAIMDPNGTITQSNFQSIGQTVDYVVGPEVRLRQKDKANGITDRISLIGGVGATTPLTSTQLQYSLTAPSDDTQQCFQIVQAYPTFLANGAANTATNCTVVNAVTKNAVKTLSYTSADRSNFLVKYGAGIRLTHIYPAKSDQAPYAGNVDFLIGQDQAVTGGRFHGAVFKVDAVYPLGFGASSYMYLFGSASMKTTGNSSNASIVLGTTPNPTPPLGTSVVVLPFGQPNRDFFRIGVGLNITAIFCRLSKDGCNSASTSATATSDGSSKSGSAGANPGKGGGGGAGNPGGDNTDTAGGKPSTN